MDIECSEHNVGEFIFDGKKKYVIPSFQRSYTWSKKNWDATFTDLEETLEEKEHFLGMFVLSKDNDKDINMLTVVDGQQRLATLSILYLAFNQVVADIFLEEKAENDNQNLSDAKDLQNYILTHIFIANRGKECEYSKDKLVLSLSLCNNDQEIYRDLCISVIYQAQQKLGLITQTSPNIISDEDNQHPLWGCYNHFYKKICASRENGEIISYADIRGFIDIIEKAWFAVTLIMPSIEEAGLLFDSLNNRGVPLSSTDIIKNYLFIKLHAKTPSKLDKYEGSWNEMVDTLEDPGTLEQFFVDFFNTYRKDNSEMCNGQKFSPITKNKDKLIKGYKKLIDNTAQNPEEILRVLLSKAKIYQQVVHPRTIDNKSKQKLEFKWKLVALISIGAVPAHGLLMYLFDTLGLDKNDTPLKNTQYFTEVVDDLSKYMARRHLTDNPQPKFFPSIFNKLIEKYHLNGIPMKASEVFIDLLDLTKEKVTKPPLPGIQAVKAAIASFKYNSSNTELLRYMFCLYEDLNPCPINSTIRDKVWKSFWEKEEEHPNDSMQWTIEHILPQGRNLPPKWKIMLGNDASDFQKFVHDIGNLTLLERNSIAATRPFAEKKTHYKSHLIYLNDEIISDKCNSWDKNAINARSLLLSEKIGDVLKYSPEEI